MIMFRNNSSAILIIIAIMAMSLGGCNSLPVWLGGPDNSTKGTTFAVSAPEDVENFYLVATPGFAGTAQSIEWDVPHGVGDTVRLDQANAHGFAFLSAKTERMNEMMRWSYGLLDSAFVQSSQDIAIEVLRNVAELTYEEIGVINPQESGNVLMIIQGEFDLLDSMYAKLNPFDYRNQWNRYVPLFPGDSLTFTFPDLDATYTHYAMDYVLMDMEGLMDLEVTYTTQFSSIPSTPMPIRDAAYWIMRNIETVWRGLNITGINVEEGNPELVFYVLNRDFLDAWDVRIRSTEDPELNSGDKIRARFSTQHRVSGRFNRGNINTISLAQSNAAANLDGNPLYAVYQFIRPDQRDNTARLDGGRPQEMTVDAPANAYWTDTGFPVLAGESVTIEASGTWTAASGGMNPMSWFGPDGNPGSRVPFHPENCPLPSNLNWALVGKVGNEGNVFVVGSHAQFISAESGNVYLIMNDEAGWFRDNAGILSVHLQRDSAYRPSL